MKTIRKVLLAVRGTFQSHHTPRAATDEANNVCGQRPESGVMVVEIPLQRRQLRAFAPLQYVTEFMGVEGVFPIEDLA